MGPHCPIQIQDNPKFFPQTMKASGQDALMVFLELPLSMLRHPEPHLGIEVEVVVPGEEEGGCELLFG